jgi:hypothetical protein
MLFLLRCCWIIVFFRRIVRYRRSIIDLSININNFVELIITYIVVVAASAADIVFVACDLLELRRSVNSDCSSSNWRLYSVF